MINHLTEIAEEAAGALAVEQLRTYAGYMESLVRVGQGLTRTRDLKAQLDLVWEFVQQQLQVATFFIALYDAQAEILHFPLGYENGTPLVIPDRHLDNGRAAWGISGYVAKTAHEVYWDSLALREAQCRALGMSPIQVGSSLGSASCFYLPLKTNDTVIGMISIQSYEQDEFSPVLLDAFRALGSQLTVALENARLFEAEALRRQEAEALHRETQQARERLCTFFKASNALVSAKNPEYVLKDIVEYARAAAQAYGVSLVLINQVGEVSQLVTAGADHAIDLQDIIRPHGISMQVIRTCHPVTIENVQEKTERINPTMLQRGIAAVLCLPVRLEGECIGVMWVHYDQPRTFDASEVEAIQLYVNQAALAYEGARRLRELERIRQAAEALAGVADLQEVLPQIVNRAREVLQARSAALWAYDEQRDRFVLEQSLSSGISAEDEQAFLEDIACLEQTAYIVMDQGWVGVSDVSDPQRYKFLSATTRRLLTAIGVQSLQGIALAVGEEKLGVLYVHYPYRHTFTQEEQQIARTFANHAALTLKKARLLGQVSQARDTAKVVAEVSALGDFSHTLEAIVEGTREALGCDAVSLYAYDQDRNEFDLPATTTGLRNEGAALASKQIDLSSVVWNIIQLDQIYVAEDAPSDPLTQGPFVHQEAIRSSAGIPLRVGDRKVGVLFVNYRAFHHFTGEELTNIELFAHQAAVAIRNAQFYKETVQKASILQALYEAGQAMTGSLSLKEIFDSIAEQGWYATGYYGKRARFCEIRLLQGDKLISKGLYPSDYGREKAALLRDIVLYHDDTPIGITGKVVKTGAPQLINDTLQDPDFLDYDPETRSELAVPIKIGTEVIGVINVEHPACSAFDQGDQLALELLAEQAAIAIRNARSYNILQTLSKAGHAITSSLALDEILKRLAEHALSFVGRYSKRASFCSLLLLEGNTLRVLALYPPKRSLNLQKRFGDINLFEHDKFSGIAGRAAITGKAQLVNDVTQDPDYLVFNPETRSELDVPIKIGGKVIGVISVEHQDFNAFDRDDQRYLESLAVQAAIAIQNARAYNVLQALYKANNAIASSLKLEDVLNQLVEGAWNLVGHSKRARFCCITRVEGRTMEILAMYPSARREELQGKLVDVDLLDAGKPLSITGRAVTTGKAQLVGDVTQDTDYLQVDPETRSELAIPITLGETIFGVINIEHPDCAAGL